MEKSDLLDRALRDLTAEQRARVLDLVTLLGIDRDDPLWLICLAIGQLQVLVEDAPLDWKDVFVDFQEELNAWTAQHLRTLEAIATQAETTEQLAANATRLTHSLQELQQHLVAQNSISSPLHRQFESLKLEIINLREGLSHRLDQIERSNRSLPAPPPINTPLSKTTSGSSRPWGWLAALALAWVTFNLWQGQQRTAAQLELLQRQLELRQPANMQPQIPRQ